MDRPAGLGPGWLSKAEVCEAFGITLQAFDKSIRRLLPREGDHVQRVGRTLFFRCRDYLNAWADRKVQRVLGVQPTEAPSSESEEETQAEALRALTAYRWQCERRERLKNLEREGRLVDVDKIHAGISVFAGHIRRVCETLESAGETDALTLVEEAIDQAELELEESFAVAPDLDGEEDGLAAED